MSFLMMPSLTTSFMHFTRPARLIEGAGCF